ncbi:hypothetical protein A0H81_12922 [Grifola frondosa]|uniref:DUF6532 domain-containing protein n=1 Tax=Grifola frondosa TaxID=5627 RepID=A0A1C7LQU6_GRIFR|nr:hypothetical protein A0H81_12922 [Grifola frondosa]
MAKTRPTNAAKRPGLPDKKNKRRTKAEIEKERQEKEAEMKKETSKTKEKQERVAALEDDIVSTDIQTESSRVTHPTGNKLRRTYTMRDVTKPSSGEDDEPVHVTKAPKGKRKKPATPASDDGQDINVTAGDDGAGPDNDGEESDDELTSINSGSEAGLPKKKKKSSDGGRDAIAAARKMPANTSVTDSESAVAEASKGKRVPKKSNENTAAAVHMGKSGVKEDWAEGSQGWGTSSSGRTKPAVSKGVVKPPPATPKPAAKKPSAQMSQKTPGKVQDGGFVSDSDECAEQAAAQSSPAKPPGQRVTTRCREWLKTTEKAGSMKTVITKGARKQVASSKVKNEESSKKKKTSKDSLKLPRAINSIFLREYIPTILTYVGTLSNPWKFVERLAVTRKEGLKVLHTVWEVIFKNRYSDPVDMEQVAAKVTQKLSEWRFQCGQMALNLYDTFFNQFEQYDSPEERAKFAKKMLAGGLFTYEVQEPEIKGLFRTPFILQTFALHLTAIEGAVHIPGLYANDAVPRPNGAFALAVTAVERALRLYKADHVISEPGKVPKVKEVFNGKTGNKSSNPNQFSGDNWAVKTRGWAKSVAKLSDAKMANIIESTRPLNEAATTAGGKVGGSDDEDFDRANMVDPDSD